jgi:hypothetical protein
VSAPNLQRRYLAQRISAKDRGIEWRFSFEEWLKVWTDSGHLAERGRGRGRYVMARLGDVGPYSAGNVEIIPYEKNCRDCRKNHPTTTAEMSERLIGKGRGWSFVKGGYQVTCAKRYVGRFKTQPEAEAAYAGAVAERVRGFNPPPTDAAGAASERLARK